MKNILIAGASSGIGRQLALDLAARGNRVWGTYHRQEPAETIENLSYHPLDATEPSPDLSFLPPVLDGMAYCPGSITLLPFSRILPEHFLSGYDLQVAGAVRVLQEVLPRLKKSGNASVVLFSTVAVQTGFPYHAVVSASKGAIEGLTRALAAELAPAIRVNALAPSLTDTPLASGLLSTPEKKEASALRHPLKRIGTPADIASMAAFLLLENAGWITGQVMHIDGGMSALRTV